MKNLHHLMYFALFFLVLILVTGCNQTEAPTAADAGQPSLLKSIAAAGDDDGRHGFIFASLSDGGVDNQGVHHRIFMTGSGRFDHNHVTGGGFFNHTDAASAVPQTILATGAWQARRLISFDKTDAVAPKKNPSGFNTSGILEIEVRLFPEGGPQHGIPAALKIICNIPPEGLFTGLPEGYFLDVEEGLSFEPATFPGGFPVGVTAFTPR